MEANFDGGYLYPATGALCSCGKWNCGTVRFAGWLSALKTGAIPASSSTARAELLSQRIMDGNQLRLWFSAFARLLVEELRADVLRGTSLSKATIGTIRLRCFKLAARVRVSTRRILVEWCSACPNQADYGIAHAALSGSLAKKPRSRPVHGFESHPVDDEELACR